MTYGHNIPRILEYNGTSVINANERYVLEIPDVEYPAKDRGQVIYKVKGRLAEVRHEGLVLR